VDLAHEDEVRAAADRVLDCHGRCDVLVHAATAFDRADLATMDLAVWRHVQAVNVESALLLSQAFVPGMAARGFGRIVFVVSDTVWSPPAADMLAYVTSKGGAHRAGQDPRGRARRRTGSPSRASRPG
jgi:NAD(P)-dependent dehydrogenase (short-subunit alcohol dehydrogenase family)